MIRLAVTCIKGLEVLANITAEMRALFAVIARTYFAQWREAKHGVVSATVQ